MSGLSQQCDGIRPEAADGLNRRKCKQQRQRGTQPVLARCPDMIMPGVAVMLVAVIVIVVVIVIVAVMIVGVVLRSHA